MFKYQLDKDAEPAKEDLFITIYMIVVWGWIISLWAIPAIKNWLRKKKREKENAEEAEKIRTARDRYNKFLSSGIGKLSVVIADVLYYSQGEYPLNGTWIDLDSRWDGLWTPKPGKNPSCTIVQWRDLMDRITRLHGAFKEISFASISDNAEAKTKAIIQKYFGSAIKISKNKENMSMHIEPLPTYTAKFSSDVWFKFGSRYSDLEKLCEQYNEMAAIYTRIEELRAKCCADDLEKLPDNELKNRGLLLKFIDLMEAMIPDFYKQIHKLIVGIGYAIGKDCQVDKNLENEDEDYIRPSNYIEPDEITPGDFR